jgi:hypothetical protein
MNKALFKLLQNVKQEGLKNINSLHDMLKHTAYCAVDS